MQKRWNLLKADPHVSARLQESLKISPVICDILVQRGIRTFEDAKSFFRPTLNMLHDPWLMKDMDKAIFRIKQAIEHDERILIFGDYDVDGTTSVACMVRFLRKIHKPELIEFYIPHRYREGYGVSKAGIDFADKNNYSLIISLDCGIKSTDLIRYAREKGIDFVVCDHHLPDDILPPAYAILNPKQPDCHYPFKDLCGCGVGFKLISALTTELGLPREEPYKYLDLVATAIAADIVSMTGENRVLAYYGLQKANKDPNPGIKALKFLTGIKTDMPISSLVFMIAPRINAAGRMDDARKAVQMFVSDNYQQALQYAELLHSDNTDRRVADKTITEEALQLINDNINWVSRKSTVVYQSHWHKGVVGIVASRLIDHFYRPTIVLTRSGDYIAGSARSVAGFNVYEAVHQCRDLLIGYGGHFYAAGMTMHADNVNAFQDRFEEVVAGMITEELLVPEIIIDAEVKLSDLTLSFYNIINQMEPFGPDNTKPVFVVRNVCDSGYSRIVKEQHLRFSICTTKPATVNNTATVHSAEVNNRSTIKPIAENNGAAVQAPTANIVFTGIGFNMAQHYPLLAQKQCIDIVFTLDVNEWNGSKNLQMKVIDVRRGENQN